MWAPAGLQAYVTGYNTALEKLEGAQAKGDTPAIVALQAAITFNGGGERPTLRRAY